MLEVILTTSQWHYQQRCAGIENSVHYEFAETAMVRVHRRWLAHVNASWLPLPHILDKFEGS